MSAGTPAGEGTRLLTIMGSGETAPTMVKVHRAMLESLGPPPVPAVLLDTPFGFQENRAELARRVVGYFDESLGAGIEVASLPLSVLEAQQASSTTDDRAGPHGGSSEESSEEELFGEERLVSSVRSARYVFAGPGSPSYALRRWSASVVPALLREKLRHGGGISFSSAAALTLGVVTVPVYEIYKVGEDPHWLQGLDLLSETGLRAAVIPHFNNAEGGTHDTRFCYLGEHRLSVMEGQLPEDAFVLGVDEHTAITFDLGAGSASVAGISVVTVRAGGRSETLRAGDELPVGDIAAMALGLAKGGHRTRAGEERPDRLDGTGEPALSPRADDGAGRASGVSPLVEIVREAEGAFAAALRRRDVKGAVAALLELESQVTAWSRDFPAGDELDRARASVRSLVVELGRVAESGARDPREALAPFVEALLEVRSRARAERRFDEADQVRARLESLGVELRDGASGTEWLLVAGPPTKT